MQSGGAKALRSPSGPQQMPRPVSTARSVALGRGNVSLLESFPPQIPCFPRPQALPALCLPPSPRRAPAGRRPPIKMRWLSGASWKVAITNPIYDSQRDKTKRWKSLNKWKIVLSLNFIHQQDHPSFKKLDEIAVLNGTERGGTARMGGGRKSHLSFKV